MKGSLKWSGLWRSDCIVSSWFWGLGGGDAFGKFGGAGYSVEGEGVNINASKTVKLQKVALVIKTVLAQINDITRYPASNLSFHQANHFHQLI